MVLFTSNYSTDYNEIVEKMWLNGIWLLFNDDVMEFCHWQFYMAMEIFVLKNCIIYTWRVNFPEISMAMLKYWRVNV